MAYEWEDWCVAGLKGPAYVYCLRYSVCKKKRIIVPYFEGAELLSQEELNQACDHAYVSYRILGEDKVLVHRRDRPNEKMVTDLE